MYETIRARCALSQRCTKNAGVANESLMKLLNCDSFTFSKIAWIQLSLLVMGLLWYDGDKTMERVVAMIARHAADFLSMKNSNKEGRYARKETTSSCVWDSEAVPKDQIHPRSKFRAMSLVHRGWNGPVNTSKRVHGNQIADRQTIQLNVQ